MNYKGGGGKEKRGMVESKLRISYISFTITFLRREAVALDL